MNDITEAEQLVAGMSRAQKAQLLQWIVRDLGDAFPGNELPRPKGRGIRPEEIKE